MPCAAGPGGPGVPSMDVTNPDESNWRRIVSKSGAFEEELKGLIERYVEAGAEPRDIVDAMSRQVALVIDQNNLELELELRPSTT